MVIKKKKYELDKKTEKRKPFKGKRNIRKMPT